MKITIIGATGMAGKELTSEALKRGHSVTAIGRSSEKLAKLAAGKDSQQLKTVAKDAFALTKADLADSDVIVDAFASSPDQAYLHVDLATKLIAMFRGAKQRLVFILGAGSLKTGEDHHLFVHDMEKNPKVQAIIEVPRNQFAELTFLRTVKNVDWVGVSPSINFHPGAATELLLGKDELLFNDKGVSETSAGTMAVAILNEIEKPQHQKERFTVADR
ncbi:NADH-flavin reductase [Liquorilactobacillus ghanensis DSM 18630]|uniref:NADH-flavin reductase n=1 Tax=Liquorilactobacillus ghanensis DSM 18630 TaxID=1423750 RepID=A0A0R1VJ86_9LACO|nr:NAD(P)H-binding protein [Liquorilactobacillus ghanensis]KRM05607.1 NADH-flavin reductase [Liquorilactobacillus ghanensis DSM 18630]